MGIVECLMLQLMSCANWFDQKEKKILNFSLTNVYFFQAATTFGFPTDWVTCSSVSNCSADFDEAIYYSLSCAVDNFGPCETEEACLASGKCTDMQVRSLINYDPLEEALPKKSEILFVFFELH